jgi:predicted regulator of Ras-like GTPase activity (Roadblock/LC7/MglB family)
MNNLDQLLHKFQTEIGSDFVSSFVIGEDGISISSIILDPNQDETIGSARGGMLMKLATKISDKLALGEVNENLVTTNTTYMITRFLGDHSYIWQLGVNRDATLGNIRMLMNEYAPKLWDSIPR